MNLLQLGSANGKELASSDSLFVGLMNIVIGAQAGSLIDGCVTAGKNRSLYAIDLHDEVGIDGLLDSESKLCSMWKEIDKEGRVNSDLIKMLSGIDRRFKRIGTSQGGQFYFAFEHNRYPEHEDLKDIEEASPVLKRCLNIGIGAASTKDGLIVISNIEKVAGANGAVSVNINAIKVLIEYLVEIAVMRDSRVILSTQSTEVLSLFNKVMARNSGIDSRLVTVFGDTAENCKMKAELAEQANLSAMALGMKLTKA